MSVKRALLFPLKKGLYTNYTLYTDPPLLNSNLEETTVYNGCIRDRIIHHEASRVYTPPPGGVSRRLAVYPAAWRCIPPPGGV